MVGAGPVTRCAHFLWDSLRNDLDGFLGALRDRAGISPGLYTYRVTPAGGTRHLQLRVEANGTGVLFIDAQDVIFLNTTVTFLAKLALDGVPRHRAQSKLRRCFRGCNGAQLAAEITKVYEMIAELSTSWHECPTCSLPGLSRRPIFSTGPQAPYKADLALTYGCNNACAHCYNEPDRLHMPSLTRTGWLRVLDKLADVGVPHIIFTGGEPTLHPNLPEFIRHANNLGQITGLNTNGRRGAQKESIQELADAGLNHIQITLASHLPDVHNTITGAAAFEQTVRCIENALESNVHTITNTTLTRQNQAHIETFLRFLDDLGIRTFAMNGMIASGGGFESAQAIPEEELAPLLLLVRDTAADFGMHFLWYTPTEYCRLSPVELEIGAKRCNAGEYTLCIEPNGDVLPCQSFYVSAGNLLKDSWDSIWHGELFRRFRGRVKNPRQAGLPAKCWDCPDLQLCGGGCSIERESRRGRRTTKLVGDSKGAVCRVQGVATFFDDGFLSWPV